MLRLILKLHAYILAATALITGSVVFFFHVVNKDYPGHFLNWIAGFEPVEWFFFGLMGLLVISMILYRIFIGPPVFTEEEEKEIKEREEILQQEEDDWLLLYDPSIPGNPGYEEHR